VDCSSSHLWCASVAADRHSAEDRVECRGLQMAFADFRNRRISLSHWRVGCMEHWSMSHFVRQ
jgi:hypothetical protein